MDLPVVEQYDEILKNAGLIITLTSDNILEIRFKMFDTFVLIHSFNDSTIDDKKSLSRRLIRQPNVSKMCSLVDAQAKVWKKFG
jgi:hypothetical protein